jgi:hypothetical protein
MEGAPLALNFSKGGMAMWSRNGSAPVLMITGMLVLASAALVGCAQVQIVDATPAAGTPIPLATLASVATQKQEHDLAILAVDFNPPLNYQQLIVGPQSLELLVAVENVGQKAEQNVTVRAELSSPDNPDMFLTQGASMARIAPGEVQIVRLGQLGAIPFHHHYHLEVVVDPVPGEIDSSNNRKAFDIQINPEGSSP